MTFGSSSFSDISLGRVSQSCKFTSWLVVSTPLKNIRQLGWLFPIYGQIKLMFQTTKFTRDGIARQLRGVVSTKTDGFRGLCLWNPPIDSPMCRPNGKAIASRSRMAKSHCCPFPHAPAASMENNGNWYDLEACTQMYWYGFIVYPDLSMQLIFLAGFSGIKLNDTTLNIYYWCQYQTWIFTIKWSFRGFYQWYHIGSLW